MHFLIQAWNTSIFRYSARLDVHWFPWKPQVFWNSWNYSVCPSLSANTCLPSSFRFSTWHVALKFLQRQWPSTLQLVAAVGRVPKCVVSGKCRGWNGCLFPHVSSLICGALHSVRCWLPQYRVYSGCQRHVVVDFIADCLCSKNAGFQVRRAYCFHFFKRLSLHLPLLLDVIYDKHSTVAPGYQQTCQEYSVNICCVQHATCTYW